MKRIFIAVGTSAVNGLAVLVRRCLEEDVYRTGTMGENDRFFGIDSDENKLVRVLRSLDNDPGRICPILIRPRETDVGVRLGGLFQSWQWTDCNFPATGVGGDRRKSCSATNWREDTQLNEALKRVGDGDEIVLIGSAFGGTSSGLFWNVAYWLRNKIKRAKEAKQIHFYALVILPSDDSRDGGDAYRNLTPNLCSFVSDIQMYSWAQQLTTPVDEKSARFRWPAFALASDGLLPTWSIDDHGQSVYSDLPLDRIFIVPTPDGGRQRDAAIAVGEIAFMLSYLGLWREKIPGKLVDLVTNRERQQKPRAFGGFHFVSARGARNLLLRRRYVQILAARWESFKRNQGVSTGPDYLWVEKRVRAVMRTDPELEKKAAAILDVFWRDRGDGTPEALRKRLSSSLVDIAKEASNCAFNWQTLEDFVENIARGEEPPPKGLCLDTICRAYNNVMAEIRRAKPDGMENAILKTTERALAMTNRRRRSKVARMLGSTEAAVREVKEEMEKALRAQLLAFVESCRCRATLPKLLGDVTAEVELNGAHSDRYDLIDEKIKAAGESPTDALPHFIYEDRTQHLDTLESLQCEDRGYNFVSAFLQYISADDGDQLSDLMSVNEYKAIAVLRQAAEERGPGNPLLATKVRLVPGPGTSAYFKSFMQERVGDFSTAFYMASGKTDDLTAEAIVERLGFREFVDLHAGPIDRMFRPQDVKVRFDHQFYQLPKDVTSTGIQGLWLGSVTYDYELHDLLAKIYSRMNLSRWQTDAATEQSQYGEKPRRLLRLNECVYLGVVLGAVERALNALVGAADASLVRVKLQVPGGDLIELGGEQRLAALLPARSGTDKDNEKERALCQIPPEWVRSLMPWIKNRFEEDFGLKGQGKLGPLLNTEFGILSGGSLEIQPEVRKMIDGLGGAIRPCISVAVRTA